MFVLFRFFLTIFISSKMSSRLSEILNLVVVCLVAELETSIGPSYTSCMASLC